ncbi:MAG TPA: cupin domain-containing protein [Nitrospirales bacterium]|nr:cupin domain-containing protein [Nitrospirales bacterium]HIN33017.1 cupin domain-containing protein [Nitrospirales bacterium]
MSVPAWGAQKATPHPVFKEGSTTMTRQAIAYPAGGTAEITSFRLPFEPGGEVGWHKHVVPTHIYVIEGTLTVEFSDGSQQAFEEGTGFLPMLNVWHNARNLGSGPLTALAVVAGEQEKAGIIFRDSQ